MDTRWQIELLGGLRARHGERVVAHFRTQKAAELLAYLAYYPSQIHPRDALVDLLWPDCEPPVGRNRLSNAVSSLRCLLETRGVAAGTVLVTDRTAVQLNHATVTTDVAAFEAALQAATRAGDRAERAQWLIRAVEAYRGELLAGHHESWILGERERLAERYFLALSQLVAHLEQAGDLDGALQYAHRAVRADPLREEGHRDLICLLATVGRPAAALRQYAELKWILQEELGVTPSAAVRTMARAIEAGTWRKDEPPPSHRHAAEGPSHPPPGVGPDRGAEIARLPLQLTRFFGREQELARLRTMLLGEGRRLVTLTGPGGSGKTRLALEAARRLADAWPDGVWFVPLADLTDPRRIVEAVRDALDRTRSPDVEPLGQVVAFLSRQPSLLLLDNFEHLVAEGSFLVKTLLDRVPSLTCLVTSRRRLALTGEREFPILPLPTPDETTASAGSSLVATLLRCDSVQLFVDRAQAVCPDFQVAAENAAAVAAICTRLEGIPLALELAAARTGVLTPAQVLKHLEHRFDFLVNRNQDAAARHRTLWATLDWSHQLLSPELQRFFARLSVFRGGCTLAAAEAVCDEPNALSCLEQLRECSLIVVDRQGKEARYGLLETLRDYAREQLTSDERAALARRHAAFYVTLAEEAAPALFGPDQGAWLDRLETERDNLRAALGWSLGNGAEVETGVRLAAALHRFWSLRDYLSEGRAWLNDLLGRTGSSGHTAAHAQALTVAGSLAENQADHEAARLLLEESVAIWRELGDQRNLALSLRSLGWAVLHQGDTAAAHAFQTESVARLREIGDARLDGALISLAAVLNVQGDPTRARVLCEESLAIARSKGNRWAVAAALTLLGYTAESEGDWETARGFLEEGLALRQEMGHKWGIATTLQDLASIAVGQSDWEGARTRFTESMRLWRELDRKGGVVECIEGLAGVAAARGQRELGARLFGAAQALRDRLGPACLAEASHARAGLPGLHAPAKEICDRQISAARAALGEEAFAVLWAEGRAMPLDQAITCALATAEPG